MPHRTTATLHRAIRAAVWAGGVAATDRDLLARFADGDQAAFAALVQRHAGLVFGVCRRALPTVQDAEDAAQATFLILARKAATTRWQLSAASWLYATARRVAQNARRAADRRARREAKAATPEAVEPADQLSARELFAILDDELGRLAAIYREPLVLCYLQELTRDEAASRLGVPVGTLKTRIDRGRRKLGDALTKRGVVAGIGVLALAATSPAGASPPRLIEAVLTAVAGEVPASVAALAEGVAVNGLFPKSLWVAAFACAATVGIGIGVVRSPAGQPPEKGLAKPQAAAVPPAADGAVYRGRVVGPNGRPVAGAKLYLTPAMGYLKQPYDTPVRATTGTDGRFEFAAPKAPEREGAAVVTAAAANLGLAWVQVSQGGKTDDLTLRLVADDVPIVGQIVDLEGRPVAGATLRVLQINAAPGEDLGPWLEAVAQKQGQRLDLEQRHVGRFTVALSPTVSTDADGRFRLTGVGRNRIVRVQLDGPTLASRQFCILTRPGPAFEMTEFAGEPRVGAPPVVATYYGATFRHAAAPTKPIVGVVRDKDTGKPLAGVAIHSFKLAGYPFSGMEIVHTTTDAEGCYRLAGMPKGKGNVVKVVPPADQPYLAFRADVPDSVGLDPVTADIELKRGVWIEGKVTDKATGRPLWASVEYFSLYTNPNLRDYPGFDGTHHNIVAGKEDGSYRVVGLPGPGLVGVYYTFDYLRAPERDDEFAAKDSSLLTSPYHISFTSNYSALAKIDPAVGAESVRRDVTLDPGQRFKGAILGPDGKPLTGARGFGVTGRFMSWSRDAMTGAEFTVQGFHPRRPRDILFQHMEKGLVGTASPPTDGSPIAVRMEPGASAAGRLIDADGKPRPEVELDVRFQPKGTGNYWALYSPERIRTAGSACRPSCRIASTN